MMWRRPTHGRPKPKQRPAIKNHWKTDRDAAPTSIDEIRQQGRALAGFQADRIPLSSPFPPKPAKPRVAHAPRPVAAKRQATRTKS